MFVRVYRVLPQVYRSFHTLANTQSSVGCLVSVRHFSKESNDKKSEHKETNKEQPKEDKINEKTEEATNVSEVNVEKKEIQDEYTIKQRKLDARKKLIDKKNESLPKEVVADNSSVSETVSNDVSASETTDATVDKTSSSETKLDVQVDNKTTQVTNKTEPTPAKVVLPPEDDAYGDIVYALEYSDAVYVPEESKNKIFELYTERHWDTKRISQTLKIGEKRVKAIIKLRSRHDLLKEKGRYNKEAIDIIEQMNQTENRQRGIQYNLEDKVSHSNTKKTTVDMKEIPKYIPRFVFLNEEQKENDVKEMIQSVINNENTKPVTPLVKREGIRLDRFPASVAHKSKICLYDKSYGVNHYTNVILCDEKNTRTVFDNKKDMNRSWNRYRYQQRNIIEDVELKEIKDQTQINIETKL